MAIVTLLSDSGDRDFYVAAVKARILSINPGIRIEDISHHVLSGNIAHAAFVLRSVYREFPKGTVHLVGVDSVGRPGDGHIAIHLDDHYFVGPNNGILSLLAPERQPSQLATLNTIIPVNTTFPERDILAPAAARLASGVSLSDLGRPSGSFKRLTDRHFKATKKQILGHVIHIDFYGNLITNIQKDIFDQIVGGRNFTVQFGSERSNRINSDYHQAEPGDSFLLFNSLGLLEIGICYGNANQLLGLGFDSPVNILFDDSGI